jgi:hypothetical protein
MKGIKQRKMQVHAAVHDILTKLEVVGVNIIK